MNYIECKFDKDGNLEDDVERLVLLGDIFDFLRRDTVGVLLENIDIVHKLMSFEPRINVVFVVGNHDVHLIRFTQSYFGVTFDLNYDLSLEYGNKGEFLVYGHTHEPFVKMEKKIANSGSWVKPSATYLEIDAEGITLKSY